MAVYQAHNLYLSTPQDPRNIRSYCSNVAEEAKRIATNRQVNHINQKAICPQEQLFYLCTITIHITAQQEMHTLDSI